MTTKAIASRYMDEAKQSEHQRRSMQFPWKLHQLLEECERNGDAHVISWLPDGKAFKVHERQEFSNRIMPIYFNSAKQKTFQRSLNLWGFEKITAGPSKGACYHSYFIRGQPDLCHHMTRVKIKGAASGESQQQSQQPPPAVLHRSSKFAEAVKASHAALPATKACSGEAPASLLHYLSSPLLSKRFSLPPSLSALPRPHAYPSSLGSSLNSGLKPSGKPSVSDFIRGSSSAASRTPPGPGIAAEAAALAQHREALLLSELRMRNDALEAALTSRHAPLAALQTLPHSSAAAAEAALIRQRYQAQGLEGQFPPPRGLWSLGRTDLV